MGCLDLRVCIPPKGILNVFVEQTKPLCGSQSVHSPHPLVGSQDGATYHNAGVPSRPSLVDGHLASAYPLVVTCSYSYVVRAYHTC